MLEGGNEQLSRFFERHEMGNEGVVGSGRGCQKKDGDTGSGNGRRMRMEDCGGARPTTTTTTTNSKSNDMILLDRYKTKAASFYRQHLMGHAIRLSKGGLYGGREASRGGGGPRG